MKNYFNIDHNEQPMPIGNAVASKAYDWNVDFIGQVNKVWE